MSCVLQVMKEQEQYIATQYKEAIDLEQELRLTREQMQNSHKDPFLFILERNQNFHQKKLREGLIWSLNFFPQDSQLCEISKTTANPAPSPSFICTNVFSSFVSRMKAPFRIQQSSHDYLAIISIKSRAPHGRNSP